MADPTTEKWENPGFTYHWVNNEVPDGGQSTGIGFTIAWQRGSLVDNGRNGAFLIEVLQACEHHLASVNSGKFRCQENDEALQHLSLAISALESRRDRRKQAGTLGTHEPDEQHGN